MKDDTLAHRVRQLAEIVRKTGRSYQLDPMNAYERRIVHNAFKDDPEVMTWSPPDDARLKRITLRRRPAQTQAHA
jgi:spoIIIJ-associated protein